MDVRKEQEPVPPAPGSAEAAGSAAAQEDPLGVEAQDLEGLAAALGLSLRRMAELLKAGSK